MKIEADRAWFNAVEANDVSTVQRLLDLGTHVDQIDQHNWSAVHTAAWNGSTDILSVLLSNAANPNLAGPGDVTALHLAAQRGHLAAVKLLLSAGACVTAAADIESSASVSALHLAASNGHSDVVRALIAAGADVTAVMTAGQVTALTALHLAVESGHLDTIDALLAAGCDVNIGTQRLTSGGTSGEEAGRSGEAPENIRDDGAVRAGGSLVVDVDVDAVGGIHCKNSCTE